MSTLLFLVATVVVCVLHSLIRSLKRPPNFPPGPDFMPWIGNTIQLRKEARACGGTHLVFEKWSIKYNSNVLGLKLGSEYVVVVLSYPLVHEVHVSEVYDGRPDNFFLRLRTMGTRKGITCTDGQLWQEHRNFAMRQMRHVGYGRTEMEQYIEKEATNLLRYIEDLQGEPAWPGSFLAPSVLNVLWTLTAGKGIDRDDKRLQKLLDMLNRRSKVFDMSGGVLTQMPWLRYVAPNWTGYNLICQMNQEMHAFFLEAINEHHTSITPANAESDLIYAYIREMNEHSAGVKNTTFSETQLTMTILDFFIAGSQTTSNTTDLALMMLALHRRVQERVYEEITTNFEKFEIAVNLCNREYFPYTNAFIMEVQRYFHITPITGPRRALWNTTLEGYSVPKNTTILIGLRSVHMDKEHWGDPENFRPQRFIDDEGKVLRDEYFMPFGQGRRRCLGDALARACLFSFLTKILHRYRIELCEEAMPSVVLQPGITLTPKPYKVRFVERS
ncbi:probable cytochrome P450 305a1 [Rhagoletis pomonella]|uniref:probable cytochrome P450 305a1 n=1 Tax=Rhagoletis pomonella TaxID=28610 RepID=UPI00177FD0DF|nr:probable cytochrome P450 305a1 [Rhagoletis pomonella]